jgi:predicted RNA methylase
MTRETGEPPEAERLKRALASRGYQPARAEIAPLLALVVGGDRETAEAASRALARLGAAAAAPALAALATAVPAGRARLVRLIGRLAQKGRDAALARVVLARVGDDDEKTARMAALAVGKLGDVVAPAELEAALLDRFTNAPPSLQRALAEALGKVGGVAALPLLDGAAAALGDARARGDDSDSELRRVVDEARLKIRRTHERQAPGAIVGQRAPARPTPARAHCRHGVAALLADEIKGQGARVVDDATVALTLRGPLASLWSARTMLRFGFPLPTPPAAASDAEVLLAAVVAALTSDEAWALLSRLTDGPIRYRLEWADAGHRRALTFRVAQAVAARRPALVNDPTASLWEAVVRERPRVAVELWPRGLGDPRFTYRQAYVPASSHPTLAAALARVAGVRAGEIVWDPFVGAGTELVERARLGPCGALYGSDADADALARARANLAAAGVVAELHQADARTFRPPRAPTLIVTNPPMGRRVLDRHRTGALFREFLAHAVEVLAPNGRIVWISPRGDETVGYARPLGLVAGYRQRVDMGGFWAELQSFTRR